MLMQKRRRASQPARARQAPRKLHLINGLLRGRIFDGQFEAQGTTYRFTFIPTVASLSERKLVLNGRFTVSSPTSGTRIVDGVEARVAATQGGVGVSPVRRQLLTGTAQTSQVATPTQKLEQEKAPETQPGQEGPQTELQPGLHSFEKPKTDEQGRPVVESTGPLSFVAVLYLHLSLDSRALGVPLDLSRVQLNARLAPTGDLERDLQNTLTDLVAALYGDTPDERAANEQVQALNRLLKG